MKTLKTGLPLPSVENRTFAVGRIMARNFPNVSVTPKPAVEDHDSKALETVNRDFDDTVDGKNREETIDEKGIQLDEDLLAKWVSGKRLSGTVISWENDMGWIKSDTGETLKVHQVDIIFEGCGVRKLQVHHQVEYERYRGPYGWPMACLVTQSVGRPFITRGTLETTISLTPGKQETVKVGQFRCAYEADDDVMYTGVIKYFNATLLFAGIRPNSIDEELDDIFCDASGIKKVGSFMAVRRGVQVEYRKGINLTGTTVATRCTGPAGQPISLASKVVPIKSYPTPAERLRRKKQLEVEKSLIALPPKPEIAPGKSPVSILHEFARSFSPQKVVWFKLVDDTKLVRGKNGIHRKTFTFDCYLDNEVISTFTYTKKKECKTCAAQLGLNRLCDIPQYEDEILRIRCGIQKPKKNNWYERRRRGGQIVSSFNGINSTGSIFDSYYQAQELISSSLALVPSPQLLMPMHILSVPDPQPRPVYKQLISIATQPQPPPPPRTVVTRTFMANTVSVKKDSTLPPPEVIQPKRMEKRMLVEVRVPTPPPQNPAPKRTLPSTNISVKIEKRANLPTKTLHEPASVSKEPARALKDEPRRSQSSKRARSKSHASLVRSFSRPRSKNRSRSAYRAKHRSLIHTEYSRSPTAERRRSSPLDRRRSSTPDHRRSPFTQVIRPRRSRTRTRSRGRLRFSQESSRLLKRKRPSPKQLSRYRSPRRLTVSRSRTRLRPRSISRMRSLSRSRERNRSREHIRRRSREYRAMSPRSERRSSYSRDGLPSQQKKYLSSLKRKQPRLRTGTRLRERSREPLGRQSRERLRLRPRERLLSRSRDRLRSRSKERQRSPLTDRYRSPPRKVAISLSRDRWSPLKGRRLSPRELTRSSSGKRISSSSRGGRSSTMRERVRSPLREQRLSPGDGVRSPQRKSLRSRARSPSYRRSRSSSRLIVTTRKRALSPPDRGYSQQKKLSRLERLPTRRVIQERSISRRRIDSGGDPPEESLRVQVVYNEDDRYELSRRERSRSRDRRYG